MTSTTSKKKPQPGPEMPNPKEENHFLCHDDGSIIWIGVRRGGVMQYKDVRLPTSISMKELVGQAEWV